MDSGSLTLKIFPYHQHILINSFSSGSGILSVISHQPLVTGFHNGLAPGLGATPPALQEFMT